MKFTEFNFSSSVLSGIAKAGFEECMPVQEQVFKIALDQQKDVTVQSQTGTGKTAAFLLTIFESFLRNADTKHRALIIAPTRELAVQIEDEAKLLGKDLDFKTGCFYGGAGYSSQERALREGVDIAIGTPGRLIDFINSGKLSLLDVDTLVIDEADRLFDMGFYPDLKKILKKMVKPEKRQTMLFSATMSLRVDQLAWEFLHEPENIEIDSESVTVDEIEQELYHVASHEKFNLLLGLLDRYKPANSIIFTNTKDMTVRLSKRLQVNGYHAEYIMGDLPQKQRLKIIESIKKGELEILVATDVAARGLHINDLDMVINYDIPEDAENYVHRIGRTARAGKSGKAVTLACEKFVFGLEAVEDFISMKIPVEWAGEELLKFEDKSSSMRITGIERPGGRRDGRRDGRRSGGQRDGRRDGRRSSGRRPDSRQSSSRGDQVKQGVSRGTGRPSSVSPTSPAKRPSAPGPKPADRTTVAASSAAKSPAAPPHRSPKEDSPAPKERRPPSRGRKNSRRDPEGGSDRNRQKKAGETRKPAKVSSSKTPGASGDANKPDRNKDIEARLAYYRKKYGEDFEFKETTGGKGTSRGGNKQNPEHHKSKSGVGGVLRKLFRKEE